MSKKIIFIIGFCLGFILLNIINIYTKDTYLNVLRDNLRAEQQILAVKSMRDNDIIDTLMHRKNVVSTYSENEFSIFNCTFSLNDFWQPFQLLALKAMSISKKNSEGKKISEGIEMGKLAYTLDLAGMSQAADTEWTKASNLANYGKNLDKFKTLISTMIKEENEEVER